MKSLIMKILVLFLLSTFLQGVNNSKILKFFLRIFLVLIASSFTIYGQINENFENGLLNGWYSEGDGNHSIASNIANDEFSLKIEDNATGIINFAIAPSIFLGNWSNATDNDSIKMDIYVESTIPDLLDVQPPVFEIVSPGGKATILNGIDLERNVWHTISVSLNANDWVQESGTWNEMINNITLFRIRAEYISGFENVYIDNVQLSFTPEEQRIEETTCSDFEDGTFDGWYFEDNGPVSVNSQSGNPGFGISVGDVANIFSQALAPPKFLGDWTPFENSGTIKFDLLIETNAPNSLFNKNYLIKISGNNSSAQVELSEAEQNLAINQWHTYEFPISQNNWIVTSGDWNSLISNVSEIRIELEYIAGDEIAHLDNFCIIPNLSTNTNNFELLNKINVYPNPSEGMIFLRSNDILFKNIELINATGQTIQGDIKLYDDFASIRTNYKGVLFILVRTQNNTLIKKIITK